MCFLIIPNYQLAMRCLSVVEFFSGQIYQIVKVLKNYFSISDNMKIFHFECKESGLF